MKKICVILAIFFCLSGLTGYLLCEDVTCKLQTYKIEKTLEEGPVVVNLTEFTGYEDDTDVFCEPRFKTRYSTAGVYEYEVYKAGLMKLSEREKITVVISKKQESEDQNDETDVEVFDEEATEIPQESADTGFKTIKGIIIVNKTYPAPDNFPEGEDAEAVAQLRKLIADMQEQGLNVSSNYSGFRTYDYQKQLYENYVARDGQALADTYSARPGYSEHHTGLAFDLLNRNGGLLADEIESQWLLNNAHKYGFIVRYQEGKEAITGYMAESWHIRYVGYEHAEKIHEEGLTLEEYLGVDGGDYK